MQGRGDADAEEVAEDGSGQVVAAEFGREGGGRAVGAGGVAGEEPGGGRGGAADGGFLAGVFGLPAQQAVDGRRQEGGVGAEGRRGIVTGPSLRRSVVSSVLLEIGMPYRSIRAPAARTSSTSRGTVSSRRQCCR
ncbi:hypothetical protein ADK43_12515 [Streptomyces rimosus subsp. rimosus]|nr:hypothetical protein ADK43_12515 [Streptomyces rimosus subsp. rimosus]